MIDQYKGTIAFWIKPEFDFATHTIGAEFFASGLNTVNGHIRIYKEANNQLTATFFFSDTGSRTLTAVVNIENFITQNNWHHLAIIYDSSLTNPNEIYIDGVLASTSYSTAKGPISPNEIDSTIKIGSGNNFSVFDDFLIVKEVLTAGEINNIYNRGRGEGYRKNRYNSVRLANPNNNPVYKNGNRYGLNLEMKEVL